MYVVLMKQLSTYDKRKYKTYKSLPALDPRLVSLVKLLAKTAAEEDNAVFHNIKSHDPRSTRNIKDSK